MADRLTRCRACNGRGYFRCECWPGDCICGQDEETCWECQGEGWLDPSCDDYDVYFAPLPTSHPDDDDTRAGESVDNPCGDRG